jgi:sugar phosphate isomerase/epimerase
LIDVTPNEHVADRAWSYVTLGDGHDGSWWRTFCSALRAAGYDDVLSIEHEDVALPPLEGIRRSVTTLRAAFG